MRRLSGSAAVLALMLFFASATTAMDTSLFHQQERAAAISKFIKARQDQSLLCLYTFDSIRPSVNISSFPSTLDAGAARDNTEDDFMVSIPPTFEEHIGLACPFGDLQLDPQLVTSFRDGSATSQLGVHLAEDPSKDRKRPQIASNGVIPAKEFFSWATSAPNGYTFEFVYRRRVEQNQTMTLFSIGSRFGDCVDPGFRVDLTPEHGLVMIYFLPIFKENQILCYERRLYSSTTQKTCAMPPYRAHVEDNPVVHVTVTMDATRGSEHLRHRFYLTYVDPVTMDRHDCNSVAGLPAPDADVEYDYIQGTYRLFIGNNPHNVSVPLQRSRIAVTRQYRDPYSENLPPEERLRAMIKQKLDTIQGPRIPPAMRMFGGKGVSMEVLGVKFPPINEDTPFAFIRDAIDNFKKDHGEDIVNFVVKSLRDGNKTSIDKMKDQIEGSNKTATNDTDTPRGLYPDADGSNFDLFHFAIYNKPLTDDDVKKTNWKAWMTPFRPFMERKRTIHILEDQEILLDLLQLHSIYDDLQLELLELPRFGKVLSYPNKTLLTNASLPEFRELPMEQQQKIYFVPEPDQNNANIPIENGLFDFDTRFEAYAVIRFRVWNTTSGRTFNASRVGVIEIFVDPVDEPPHPREPVVHIQVGADRQARLDLEGVDDDGESSQHVTTAFGSRRLGFYDNLLKSLGGSETTPPEEEKHQTLTIVQFPRYGRLYDRKMVNTSNRMKAVNDYDVSELEPYRIQREWIESRKFSTSLLYVADRHAIENASATVDELVYRLSMGNSDVLSDSGSVVLHLQDAITAVRRNDAVANVVDMVQVDEDSAATVSLLKLEPLMGQLSSKTKIKVMQLPQHGRLYQFTEDMVQPTSTPSSNASGIGILIETSGQVVSDAHGRLVYVPDANYFNAVGGDTNDRFDGLDMTLDSFGYGIVAVQADAKKNAISSSLLQMRTIQIQVLNVPDSLMVLPPTVFKTNATRGEPLKVPIIFDDPDGFTGSYRVTLEAKDDVSLFEFGHVVTDDDVLKYCPFERPCSLTRSANASFVSRDADRGDETEDPQWQLHFVVKRRNWDPTHIEVEGSKAALQSALSELIFRDATMWTWYHNHTAKFEATIERVNSSFDAKTKMMYYVDFATNYGADDGEDSLSHALTNLFDLISMGFWIALMCFLLSSASCCSMSFCCCCSRARTKKRQEFDDERRRYVEQVVQNDGEYSSLLMAMVDVLLEPDLHVCTLLLRSCGDAKTNQRTEMQSLCLKSLLPLLETERQGIRFVLRLLSIEFQERQRQLDATFLESPSAASVSIAAFCEQKGNPWLQKVIESVQWHNLAIEEDAACVLMDALERNINDLPAEIVVLCRACATIVSSSNSANNSLDGVHIVFCNHFIAPALWFTLKNRRGSRIHRPQARLLLKALAVFARRRTSTDLNGDDKAASPLERAVEERYDSLLRTILSSPKLPSSFDTTMTKTTSLTSDCELLASCLMNLHSILESTLPRLEAEEKRRAACDIVQLEDTSIIDDQLDDPPLARIKRLLPALNFPLATADTLVSSCHLALSSDELFWNGFSSSEWQTRITAQDARALPPPQSKAKSYLVAALRQRRAPPPAPPRLQHAASSLLAVDIVDEEDMMTTSFETSRSNAGPPPQHHGGGEKEFCVEFEF